MLAHKKKDNFDTNLFNQYRWFLFTGALIGGFGVSYVDVNIIKIIFALLAVVIAISMIRKEAFVLSDSLPKNIFINKSIPTFMGILSSSFGIGGGVLGVPIFRLFGVPIKRAIATSSGFGLYVALPACIGYIYSGIDVLLPFTYGYINIIALVSIASMSILFAPIGAKMSHSINPDKLKKIFALFLCIVSIKMIYSAL